MDTVLKELYSAEKVIRNSASNSSSITTFSRRRLDILRRYARPPGRFLRSAQKFEAFFFWQITTRLYQYGPKIVRRYPP